MFENTIITNKDLDNHLLFLKYGFSKHGAKGIVVENKKIITKNFCYDNLSFAIFRYCDFINGTNFKYANLYGAVFKNCTLNFCYFESANLSNTKFESCDLTNSVFSDSILNNAQFIHNRGMCELNKSLPIACPNSGEFIGWKKAYHDENYNVIVKLLIPNDAKRISGTGLKCRTDKALVLDIQDIHNVKHYDKAYSYYDRNFVYKIGEYVTPTEDFCEDRFDECSSGIHFFINRNTAVDYY